jgi:hypothetical protein
VKCAPVLLNIVVVSYLPGPGVLLISYLNLSGPENLIFQVFPYKEEI